MLGKSILAKVNITSVRTQMLELNLTSPFHSYPTPKSRPVARAVQPGPARAGKVLPRPSRPAPGPAAGLTAPAAPGPRPGGSGTGHAPALRPAGRHPAYPGPSSAFFAASVETERLPKEKEGCSLPAPLPGKSGHLLPLKSGGGGSVPAPRRTMAPEWAAGAALRAGAAPRPSQPRPGELRPGGVRSVTHRGQEGSRPPSPTLLPRRFLNVSFPCGASVPGKRLKWPLRLCPCAPGAVRAARPGSVRCPPPESLRPARPACCWGPEPVAALGAARGGRASFSFQEFNPCLA